MTEALEETALKDGRPFLGICVSMQLLSIRGLEKELTGGLGWIEGDVIRMSPAQDRLKVPQVDWNTLELTAPHALFKAIPTGSEGLHAYFVRSYHFECEDRRHCLAITDYGSPITAAVARNNLAGTQFHPEKTSVSALISLPIFWNSVHDTLSGN